jgi:hypothetical protein
MKDQDLFPKGERAFSVPAFDRPSGKGKTEIPPQIGQPNFSLPPRFGFVPPPASSRPLGQVGLEKIADRHLPGQEEVVLLGQHRK